MVKNTVCRSPSSTIVFGGDPPRWVPEPSDSNASIWPKSKT
jgi:hypothetical protein